MGSMQWTEEEASYLKAIFTWQEISDDGRSSARSNRLSHFEAQNRPPADVKSEGKAEGDFRVLIVGAQGCGKTSALIRSAFNIFEDDPSPTSDNLEGGCRQSVQIRGLKYNVHVLDVLELPSKNLTTSLMLEQALAITEGAVLLYDITDQDSLEFAIRVQRRMGDYFWSSHANTHGIRREYGLLLVGNKSDVDDEDRVVAWAEGSKTASGFDMSCSFLEISAKTGDNVTAMFSLVCQEILRLRQQSRERQEEADMVALLRLEAQAGAAGSRRKRGFWKTLTGPFSRRRDRMRV